MRTYAFIDRMQPQAAAHVAATCQGDVPIAGMAELFIEVAPGNEVFRGADIALKAADVRPALQIIEREFGLLEIHSEHPGRGARRGPPCSTTSASPRPTGSGQDRVLAVRDEREPLPSAVDQQVAQGQPADARSEPLRPRGRTGRLRVARRERGREGRRHPVIEVRAVGRFGRLFVCGTESDVQAAERATIGILDEMVGREMTVVTAADVERATSPLVIGPGDIVTPLARDRLKELDVVIELRDGSRTSGAPEAPERRPVRFEPPPASSLLEPASGALYRRGAPLPGASEDRDRSSGRSAGPLVVPRSSAPGTSAR